MPRSPSLAIATALFFFSGALGLGYELVWIRKAALVVGASQIAMSTVLTSFFLGIAFGSYFVGRYLRSTRFSPLFVYGVFEAAIGVFALAFPWLFELLELIYGAAYPLVAGSDTLLFALRFVLLFLLVLVPTFFMGGTLPLLLDALVAEDRSIGSRTSALISSTSKSSSSASRSISVVRWYFISGTTSSTRKISRGSLKICRMLTASIRSSCEIS